MRMVRSISFTKTAIGLLVMIAAVIGCGKNPPEPEVAPTSSSASPGADHSSTQAPLDVVTSPATSSGVTSIDEVPRISISDLQDLMSQDAVQIVDVRSAQSYMTAHIPGSINLPVTEMRDRLGELSRDRTIVTYCT